MIRVCLAFLCLVSAVSRCPARAAADETRSAVLYVFAHQDDEFFILAKMAREVARGCDVHAVWITDGAKRSSATRRMMESRAVMARAGVPEENLHFLGFPDQDSIGHVAAIYDGVRELCARIAFSEITTPAYEGGNIDHDVAALIGARVAAETPSRPVHHEFPLYNHFQGRARVGVFLPNAESEVRYSKLDATDRALIRDAMRLYRSQRLLLLMLKYKSDRKMLRNFGEPHRVAPTYDFLARPADDPCGYEVSHRRRSSFSRWLEGVEPFLESFQPGVR